MRQAERACQRKRGNALIGKESGLDVAEERSPVRKTSARLGGRIGNVLLRQPERAVRIGGSRRVVAPAFHTETEVSAVAVRRRGAGRGDMHFTVAEIDVGGARIVI